MATRRLRRSAAIGRPDRPDAGLMNTVIVSYGRDIATANTEFQRVGSNITGRQSHVWVRTEVGWRIAAAHVSLMPAASRDSGRAVAGETAPAFGTS